ncbi:aminopeptidase [Paenibacillus aceris]|uniref:Aminopeptidase n=1 Tax=Paenibacillus aceris TaxID=869555 RepID=A0ABS4HUW4_9BACL|nr:aminopeptidase [Paenibacillus aceris]MBP1961809.1 aminopeptidase [Paenibacillus aceris]NHW34334.1 aminopeptidase [Paenibacillus aceris]
MDNFITNLEKYAELVVKIGVNLTKGQDLMIESPMECLELTRLIVKKAYEAGANFVQVNWQDDVITRSRLESAHEDALDYYPKWHTDMLERFVENGGALLNIKVPDPDLYAGIDASIISRASKAMATARSKYQKYVRTSTFSWCLIKAPTVAWASKVYADLPEDERVDAMWDVIFRFNRVYENDPVSAWRVHIEQLKRVRKVLNEKQYAALQYRAEGTDLLVELPEGHIWLGGDKANASGIRFVANMPTEEVFTMPKRTGVHGTVASTKPLNVNGALVDNFSFRFEDGKVVEYKAEVGYEHLARLLEMDEGARYLGEVALVPYDSPISNMNRIFYNTGIDENASCHLALGSCYPINIEDGASLSNEELKARGGNTSLIHVDFMIGTADLEIDGVLQDGTLEPIFRKGNWALAF